MLWKMFLLLHSFTVKADDMYSFVHSGRFRIFEKQKSEKPKDYCHFSKNWNYFLCSFWGGDWKDLFFYYIVEAFSSERQLFSADMSEAGMIRLKYKVGESYYVKSTEQKYEISWELRKNSFSKTRYFIRLS